MENELRFSKKFKYSGRNAYYYNAFVNDVIVSTIRYDRNNGWWASWHRTLIPATEEEKKKILTFVAELNDGDGGVNGTISSSGGGP